MSESAPPPVAGDTGGRREPLLTAETIETILAEFRAWLQEAGTQPLTVPPAGESNPIDLHTLLGQMTALRHEVNLQTRAARAQQEQAAQALEHLGRALDVAASFQDQAAPPQASSADESVRPLLKTLLDVNDALSLARREVERVQLALERAVAVLAEPVRNAAVPAGSIWSRWFGPRPAAGEVPSAGLPEQEREAAVRTAAEQVQQFFESVRTGYTMSLQRVDRALHQMGLEPIAAEGERFDPERMEVVEAVPDSGRPAGEVVRELRRGYLWHGRVLRYAQVSVAR